jgi:MSHA biogenesis protein MshM
VLSRAQVACYVRARLQMAGVTDPIFSQAALWLLHFYSRGIPRLINILAHKALMLGFGKAKQQLGCTEIIYAARDTDDVQAAMHWWSLFGVLGSAVLAAVWYWLPGGWW